MFYKRLQKLLKVCKSFMATDKMTLSNKLKKIIEVNFISEIPGSLVSEPKHRDSRSKTRLGLGTGLEFSRTLEPESDSESNFLLFWNRNRYRNRILRGVVPESEPESKF